MVPSERIEITNTEQLKEFTNYHTKQVALLNMGHLVRIEVTIQL